MSDFMFTQEMYDYATGLYSKLSIGETTELFNKKFGTNRKPEQLRGNMKARGFRNGRTAGEIMKGVSKLFSKEQVKFIRDNYAALGRKGLTKALNDKFQTEFKVSQIVGFVKNNKINSGRTGHFQKGQPSWSKGTKGILKKNSGSFKKGNVPHNHKPVGSERINVDGYIEIKVAEPKRWEYKHRIIYQNNFGDLEVGDVVRFKDDNKLNLDPSNLIKISRAEHHFLNKLGYSDADISLKPTIELIAKIKAKESELRSTIK
jgi:hypothetical protein